ncbi:MAG: DUF2911 domain-containing protein [Gemmatimonadota bacterium]|nr:DUF2911 domain-containing protein [Gemmatimonadota bacterium]
MASERATVSQLVDGTRLTVDYSRPRARGRTNIYGGLEQYNSAWTPGADQATTLDITRPVHVLGHAVPKGKYSLWLVLREQGAWTLVLDPRPALFHTAHPDSTREQIRAPIMPINVPHTEILTWTFSAVTISSATLEMRWGTKGIAVPIEITPTYPLTVNAAEVAPLIGVYDFTPTGRGAASVFTISLRGDKLFGVWKEKNGSSSETQLLQSAPDEFMRTDVHDGEIWSLLEGSKFLFKRAGDVVTGFDLMFNKSVDARGVRRRP